MNKRLEAYESTNEKGEIELVALTIVTCECGDEDVLGGHIKTGRAYICMRCGRVVGFDNDL
jgi:hypothetical protein